MQIKEFVLFFAILFIRSVSSQLLDVQTSFGTVRGVYETHINGDFFSYMGIPYAQNPIGNPFGDPIDPLPWDEVKVVSDSNVECPQRRQSNIVGLMDCLKVNVYVPANRTAPLPVLFWIYGGAFWTGSSSREVYGPEFLIRHDIILVTINYRVGPFGFLCLGTEEIPGNAGIKDLVKGLQWVQNNIANFGGDPEEVTIAGSSAGGSSVEYLITSPMAAGLFKQGILQSGTATAAQGMYVDYHHQQVVEMANYLGYRGGSVVGSVYFLLHQEPLNIIAAAEQVDISFMICKEREIQGVEAFLTEIPAKLIQTGSFKAVNLIMGFNSKEVAISNDVQLDESYSSLFNKFLDGMTFFDSYQRETVAEKVRNFYIGSATVTNGVKTELENLQSDQIFSYPVFRSAMMHSRLNVTVYFYIYGYSGDRDSSSDAPGHADEISYLFNQDIWTSDISEEDSVIIDRLTGMWTNFVKYGDPTPEITDMLPVKWLPMEYGGYSHYITINADMDQSIDPRQKRFAFCDLLYNAYLHIR